MKKYIEIANAHMEAAKANKFTYKKALNKKALIEGLDKGETFEALHKEIVFRYVSVTSQLIGACFGDYTKAAKAGIRKGYRNVCETLDIK